MCYADKNDKLYRYIVCRYANLFILFILKRCQSTDRYLIVYNITYFFCTYIIYH